MSMRAFRWIAPAAFLATTLIASNAMAWSITYSTPSNSFDSNHEPLSARATFVTGTNLLSITLTNTLAETVHTDPTSIAQNLSDLGFTLNSNQTFGTFSTGPGTTSFAFERTVNANRSFSLDTDTKVDPKWGLETGVNGGMRLCDLCSGGDAPAHTIIGAADPNNLLAYTHANGTIAGSNNPFLRDVVTFYITVAGLTDNDYVDSAFFSFGAVEGDNVNGVCTQSCRPGRKVPEPSSLVLLGAGLLGLAGAGWRKRRIAK